MSQTSLQVWCLLALGCVVGVIAAWVSRGPRKTRLRLLNKPTKARLPVLVPPGPAPRLIPSDSPNATRPVGTGAPLSRQLPAGATHINYIAAFADSGKGSEGGRVDYLLVASDDDSQM